ncbi:MAG: hypothetical protein JSS82_18485 [Bacteroidetes bacterium]|nr:hypothetical protein [Bacteroidota bacterium]
MQKVIIVPYTLNSTGQELNITIAYTIDANDDLHTITCTVNPGMTVLPFWLQRKFNIRLMYTDRSYERLFSETNIIRTLDTSLFIDKVYAMVMAKEKMRMMAVEL